MNFLKKSLYVISKSVKELVGVEGDSGAPLTSEEVNSS